MASQSKRVQATIRKETMSPGRVIAGKYRYVRSLGEGGMGQVYLVCDIESNQKLAMKCCLGDHEKRFEREVHSWLRLGRHPNVVAAIYFDWVDGVPSLFIEYIEGGTLSEVIQRSREEKKDIPTEIVFDYAIQICRGMAHLHKNGIIHRDLKPSNILVAKEDNGPGILKITDMGLSKFKGWEASETKNLGKTKNSEKTSTTLPQIKESGIANSATHILPQNPELTHTYDMLGTPQYMSPQQYESSKEVEEETDIYSFGLIIYELLAQGKKPFDAGDDYRGWLYAHTYEVPKHIKNHVTSRFSFFQRKSRNVLTDLIMQCLAKKSEERPSSFLEIENRLKDLYTQIFSRKYDMERQLFVSAMSPADVNNQAVSLLEMGGVYAEEGARKLEKLCQTSQDCMAAKLNRLLFQLKNQKITLQEFWHSAKSLSYNDKKERAKILQIMLGAALERGSFLSQSLYLLEECQSLSWSSALLRLHAKWRYCLGDYTKAIKLFQNICRSSFAIAEDFYHYAGAIAEQALLQNNGHILVEKNNYSLILDENFKQQILQILQEGEQKCGNYVWFQEAKDRILGKSSEKISYWHEYGILEGHKGAITNIDMTGDQYYASSSGMDNTVRIWDLKKQKEISCWEHPKVSTISIAPQGEYVLSGSQNFSLYLWDNQKKKIIWRHKHSAKVTSVAFSGNSQIAASGDASGKIVIWDVNKISQTSLFSIFSKKKIREFQSEFGAIERIALSLDGNYLLSSTESRSLLLWNLNKQTSDPLVLASYLDTKISSIAISSDNKLVMITTDASQNNVCLWEISTGNFLLNFTGILGPIDAMSISANGRLVFVTKQGIITLWDMMHREKIAFLEGHSNTITDLTASLDGSMLISSSFDGTLRLWKNSFIWPLICQQPYLKIVPELEEETPADVIF